MTLKETNASVDLEQINEEASDSAAALLFNTLSSLFSLSCNLSALNSSILSLHLNSPHLLPTYSSELISLTSQFSSLSHSVSLLNSQFPKDYRGLN
ncbi:MAG: hypothetical protein [Microvirus sp.]|nr:MAG: hypothetical protein [Microvirus sp.]